MKTAIMSAFSAGSFEIPDSSVLHVLGDDPESLHDIPALLNRLGLEPAIISEAEIGWKFIIRT